MYYIIYRPGFVDNVKLLSTLGVQTAVFAAKTLKKSPEKGIIDLWQRNERSKDMIGGYSVELQ